jgi:hypothetical protein
MVGCTALFKFMLASQAIYHLTPLFVPPGVIGDMEKIERPFLWAAKEKVMGAQYKVNWNMVCPPKLGRPWSPLWGNFSRSLRIR